MSDYVCTVRSNYFAVKDMAAFDLFCEKFELDKIEKDGLVGFVLEGDYPWQWDPDTEVQVDLRDQLYHYLAPDHVAIVLEIGHSDNDYLVGSAIAINEHNSSSSFGLNDITEMAKLLGKNVTPPIN